MAMLNNQRVNPFKSTPYEVVHSQRFGSCICHTVVPPMFYTLRSGAKQVNISHSVNFSGFDLFCFEQRLGCRWVGARNSEGHTYFEDLWRLKGEFMWFCREICEYAWIYSNLFMAFYGHFNQEHDFLSHQAEWRKGYPVLRHARHGVCRIGWALRLWRHPQCSLVGKNAEPKMAIHLPLVIRL
jgi:hypothetical protein